MEGRATRAPEALRKQSPSRTARQNDLTLSRVQCCMASSAPRRELSAQAVTPAGGIGEPDRPEE